MPRGGCWFPVSSGGRRSTFRCLRARGVLVAAARGSRTASGPPVAPFWCVACAAPGSSMAAGSVRVPAAAAAGEVGAHRGSGAIGEASEPSRPSLGGCRGASAARWQPGAGSFRPPGAAGLWSAGDEPGQGPRVRVVVPSSPLMDLKHLGGSWPGILRPATVLVSLPLPWFQLQQS